MITNKKENVKDVPFQRGGEVVSLLMNNYCAIFFLNVHAFQMTFFLYPHIPFCVFQSKTNKKHNITFDLDVFRVLDCENAFDLSRSNQLKMSMDRGGQGSWGGCTLFCPWIMVVSVPYFGRGSGEVDHREQTTLLTLV